VIDEEQSMKALDQTHSERACAQGFATWTEGRLPGEATDVVVPTATKPLSARGFEASALGRATHRHRNGEAT
jgi:hypothetical protein